MFKCRLPARFLTMFPPPLTRNRFLTLLFVFCAIPRATMRATAGAHCMRPTGARLPAAPTSAAAVQEGKCENVGARALKLIPARRAQSRAAIATGRDTDPYTQLALYKTTYFSARTSIVANIIKVSCRRVRTTISHPQVGLNLPIRGHPAPPDEHALVLVGGRRAPERRAGTQVQP
jgi:hypothetical protein